MRHLPLRALPALTVALLCVAAPTSALAGAPGGTPAPSSPRAGGSEFGAPAHVSRLRPVVSRLSVPRTATAERMPRVTLRLEEPGVETVAARVTVTDLSTRARVVSVPLGWVHTRRTLTVGWPSRAVLAPGSYQVTVTAYDHHGGTLVRLAHAPGVATS